MIFTLARFCLVAALVLSASASLAQERTAGSPLDTQMTWSGLSSKITTVSQRTDSAHIRIDQVQVCGSKGMVYSPGGGGDSQGCVMPAVPPSVTNQISNLTTNLTNMNNSYGASFTNLNNTINNINNLVTNIVACGDQGLVYDKSANGCYQEAKENNRWVTGRLYDSSVEKSESKAKSKLTSTLASAGITQACSSSMAAGRTCSNKGEKCYGAVSVRGVDCTNMGGDRGNTVCFSFIASSTNNECN
jgi:hypothetical protein